MMAREFVENMAYQAIEQASLSSQSVVTVQPPETQEIIRTESKTLTPNRYQHKSAAQKRLAGQKRTQSCDDFRKVNGGGKDGKEVLSS